MAHTGRTWASPRALGLVVALVVIVTVVVVTTRGGDPSIEIDDVASATTRSTPTLTSTTRVASTAGTAVPGASPSTAARADTTTSAAPTIPAIEVPDLYEPPDPGEGDDAAVSERPVPDEDLPPPTTAAPPPWAASTRTTSAGLVQTDVGCAGGTSAAELHDFVGGRLGPLLGWDYQHIYPLGGDRYLWLFQDAFIDHSGAVDTLGGARFTHNAALVQTGRCFQLLHRGTPERPLPFETGDGSGGIRTTWWWPMGGELVDGRLWVIWVEMNKDPYDPDPPDGLGWHPARTMMASYDPGTLRRESWSTASNSGVLPVYGYAVSSDAEHTYLFGNTFEQNLVREGGYWNGPHSATAVYLARVPRGRLGDPLQYRTADGWSWDAAEATPIVARFWVENPMQPRFVAGQWVSVTAVDGYWGDHLAVDVANEPWGPWTTVRYDPLLPRGADPKMNTYHAHLAPWLDGDDLVVTVSNNARNMRRDAWNTPSRYRPMVIGSPLVAPPPPPTTSTTSTTTIRPTTTTTRPPRPTTTTTRPTTTTTRPPRPTTTTTRPATTTTRPTTTTTTRPTTTTTRPPRPTTTTTTTTSTTTTSTTTTTTTSTTTPPTSTTTTTSVLGAGTAVTDSSVPRSGPGGR